MKFKAPIEIQAGISDGDPTNPLGISGYLLSSDGSNVNWVSPGGLSAETAEAIVQPIKANEALVKGDPVYIVGYNNGQDVNIVAKADSSDVAKMPVVGLADDDYANQAFGTMTAFGSFNGDFDTTGGTESWAVGDIIFVKPGGGLTNIKPGGTDLIQNVAIVSRVNSQTGELEVIALGRTNDVPNLPTGRLFVGTAANTSLTSDVVYVDDANERVGIRTTGTPSTNLEVSSSSNLNGIDISKTTNPTQSGALFFTTNTTSEGFLFRNSNGTFQINSGGIPNNTSGTNRISIIGSSGNVGIGTTSPNAKLDVYGGLHLGTTGNFSVTQSPFTTTQFYVTGGGNGGTITFGAPASNTQNVSIQGDLYSYQGSIGTKQFGSFNNKISYNGNNYLNSGNLGIGTTSPYAKLHVASTSSNNVPTAGTATGGLFVSNSNKTYGINMGVASSGWGFIQSQRADANTTLYNLNLQPLGGNVGIGTTSPRTKLHVSGLTGDDDPALGSSTAPFFVSNTATSYGLNIGVNNVGASWLQAQSNTSATAYEMSLNPLGGNVGVGFINPAYKLDVNGTGRFTNTLYYSSLVQQSQADTKKDIANIDKNKATAIPFKQYKYKTGDTERVRYGVVVEDIEQYYPELVHIGEDGIKGVSYIDLLVKRVAELEKELEDISLTPGPKGDTGATGAAGTNGADGKNGADGNSHLSNVTSIAFNPKANRLQVNIGGTVYNFAPSK